MENNRPLGWTTLEESKLLVEAGLDPNTADMCYIAKDYIDGKELRWYTKETVFEKYRGKAFYVEVLNRDKTDFYPCWSIGALENLIPRTIKVNDAWFHYHSSFGIKGWSCTYEDIVFHRHLYYDEFKNQIEMLVKLIHILLQDNHIKKHE